MEEEELIKIFNELNENEQFGLSFGLFPMKLFKLHLDNHETAELIKIAQEKSGVKV